MANFGDLLKALGIPAHEDSEAGQFFLGLDGCWRHTCAADFPFQSDVELIFDLNIKTKSLPSSMPRNVAWIQAHLAEIWNAAAFAINGMAETQAMDLNGDFSVEPIHFRLPQTPVESSRWTLTIEPTDLGESFEITFEGLTVIDQKHEGS